MEDGDKFRIDNVNKIKQYFETEIQIRRKIYLKYKKINNICDIMYKVSAGITLFTGVGGIAVSSTIIMWPLTILLESITIMSGLTSIITTILYKYSHKKVKKHEEIKGLAINKLIIINKIISDAVNDDIIDNNEFDLIQKHYEVYFKIRRESQIRFGSVSE